MTSFRQIEANGRKSTGPITQEGKQRSRCNAAAETVIGALEDVEHYKAFEAAIIADYDAQSTVERELVLQLASLLWRLRATKIETGLFEIQANHLSEFRRARQALPSTRAVYAMFGRTNSTSHDRDPASHGFTTRADCRMDPVATAVAPNVELTRCFLRLANLPSFALDRLNRYEAIPWHQASQIFYALDALDRRKPQERKRRFNLCSLAP
jgi:hypothetical protein